MSHHTKLLVLFSAVIPLLAIAAAPALAENPAPAAADTAQVADPIAMPVIDTQLAREVRALQADFNGRLAGLTARYQAATDQTAAAAIRVTNRRSGLDLDADDPAGAALHDDVDFLLVLVR